MAIETRIEARVFVAIPERPRVLVEAIRVNYEGNQFWRLRIRVEGQGVVVSKPSTEGVVGTIRDGLRIVSNFLAS